MCWGRKEGRKDNSTCSSDDNTVAPHSDNRILKDRKKQMMTVKDSVVGGQMSRGTVPLSEKEDAPRQFDRLFENRGNEPEVVIYIGNGDTRMCKLNVASRTSCQAENQVLHGTFPVSPLLPVSNFTEVRNVRHAGGGLATYMKDNVKRNSIKILQEKLSGCKSHILLLEVQYLQYIADHEQDSYQEMLNEIREEVQNRQQQWETSTGPVSHEDQRIKPINDGYNTQSQE